MYEDFIFCCNELPSNFDFSNQIFFSSHAKVEPIPILRLEDVQVYLSTSGRPAELPR